MVTPLYNANTTDDEIIHQCIITIEEYLKEKCLFDPTIVINCDRDKAFFCLNKLAQLENSVVDYTKENHKLK